MPHRAWPLSAEEGQLDLVSFQRIADLVLAQTGIKLPADGRLMVESRLRRRVRERGYARFADYCAELFSAEGLQAEWRYLIDGVTTNTTDFFREPAHFEYLGQVIIPALLEGRRGEPRPLLKFWSAASSNGAEAYSIAMLLSDLTTPRAPFRFAVLGTDICTAVLEQARRAIYPARALDSVPSSLRTRHVFYHSHPAAFDEARIAPAVREHVQFEELNLMDDTYPFDRDVDVIFLRNVLIYFEKANQRAVVQRLCSHLRPGGFLLLGHAESMLGNAAGLHQVAPAVFRKV